MESEPFDGFSDPTENWSKLPHEFIGLLPRIKTLGEMKVILYVLRHTWGYGDDSKRITMDEFAHGRKRKDGSRIDSGTGLSEPTLREGIDSAIEHGFLDMHTDDSDKGRIKRTFSLRVRGFSPEGKNLSPNAKESLPRSEKETSSKKPKETRESGQKTPATPEPPKRDLFPVVNALSEVCKISLDKNRGRLFKEAKLLCQGDDLPPVTPDEIRVRYGPGGWWYREDWRGQKGEPPTPAAIRQTWGQWTVPKIIPITRGKKTKGDLIREVFSDGDGKDDQFGLGAIFGGVPGSPGGNGHAETITGSVVNGTCRHT